MALADDNNAMTPQPLVAPLSVDLTQRFAGGYAMRNHGQNGSPAAQIGVIRQRRGRRRGGGAAAAAGGGGSIHPAGVDKRDRRGAGNGGVGGGRSSFHAPTHAPSDAQTCQSTR
jgi:hypothetical protein